MWMSFVFAPPRWYISKTRSRYHFRLFYPLYRRSLIPSQCSPPSSIASCHLSHQETKCIPSQFVSHNIWLGAVVLISVVSTCLGSLSSLIRFFLHRQTEMIELKSLRGHGTKSVHICRMDADRGQAADWPFPVQQAAIYLQSCMLARIFWGPLRLNAARMAQKAGLRLREIIHGNAQPRISVCEGFFSGNFFFKAPRCCVTDIPSLAHP